MKTVISGPGFYTSKAGKCEVVATRNGEAIGWSSRGYSAKWDMISGYAFRPGYIRCHLDEGDDITSIWTDKPKPIEAWAVELPTGARPLFQTKCEAMATIYDFLKFNPGTARLVHLIEAEDRT